MRDYLLRAAQNNALWCDAVCSAQGAPGQFLRTLWQNRLGTPAYYPDVVTLLPAEAAREQTAAIASLIESPRDAGWAVKDSFRSLDLHPLGFAVLFDAEWILWQPASGEVREKPAGLTWETVRSESDLRNWKGAWAADATTIVASEIFADSLISHADVSFLFASVDGVSLCGGLFNKGAGVVGLSNVFHGGGPPEITWRGLLHEAARRFPGLPVVAYEVEEELAVARRIGFQSVGPLRIWHKP